MTNENAEPGSGEGSFLMQRSILTPEEFVEIRTRFKAFREHVPREDVRRLIATIEAMKDKLTTNRREIADLAAGKWGPRNEDDEFDDLGWWR